MCLLDMSFSYINGRKKCVIMVAWRMVAWIWNLKKDWELKDIYRLFSGANHIEWECFSKFIWLKIMLDMHCKTRMLWCKWLSDSEMAVKRILHLKDRWAWTNASVARHVALVGYYASVDDSKNLNGVCVWAFCDWIVICTRSWSKRYSIGSCFLTRWDCLIRC